MSQERLVSTPIHRSLTRPILLGGAQRELALANVVIVLELLFGTPPHPLTWALALGLGTAGHSLLVKLAKADDNGWQVFFRHLQYRDYYPALSAADAPPARVAPAVERR